MPPHKKVPVVAIVGAGRVGRALGRLLHQRGWRIGVVVTRSAATARAATRAIGAGTPLACIDAAVLAADVVLITVPDRSIAAVAKELASLFVARGAHDVPRRGTLRLSSVQRKGSAKRWRGKIVLHTCGALDRTVLRPLERLGAATGSLHPLQTFGKNSVPELQGVACAIEGSSAALRTAQRICRALGCIPIRVPSGSKPAYHTAAVFAAGHILGVIEAATRILMSSGLTRQQAVHALLPLTRQTLNNFEHNDARAAGSRARVGGSVRAQGGKTDAAAIWTGPAARGDLATIRKHIAALRRFPPEYRAAYAALTKLSVSLFVPNHGPPPRR